MEDRQRRKSATNRVAEILWIISLVVTALVAVYLLLAA